MDALRLPVELSIDPPAKNVHSILAYPHYVDGFAVGTHVGMKIEERLALGTLVIRNILTQGDGELA